MYDYLPEKLVKELSIYKGKAINEIRIRKGFPVKVLVGGKFQTINKIKPSAEEIEEIVLKLCKNSIHSYEEQIKQGFITSDNGERVGLAGEFVKENGKILTIKNFTSLCVRIPTVVFGVSVDFFNKIYKTKGGNVLVLSKPCVGKTTFIRDLCCQIAISTDKNVVVVDERNEIALKFSKNLANFNANVDFLTYADKEFGFTQAIRTLNPNVIVTDELISESDVNSVIETVYGGVNVIATAHASSVEDFFGRPKMQNLKKYKVFDYYVLISICNNDRIFDYYDKDFNKLCLC